MKTLKAAAMLCLMLIFADVMPCMAANEIGKITSIQGDVDVLKPGMERAEAAALQQPLSEGDIVRTKSNTKAEITFADESVIKLAPQSRLEITEYLMEGAKRKNSVLNLFRGKMRAIISKNEPAVDAASSDRQNFQVKTPTSTAEAKGTDFFVFYNMGITGIAVKEGKIVAFNPSIHGQVIPVTSGMATMIAEAVSPRAPRPVADIEMMRHVQDTDTGKASANTGSDTTTGAIVSAEMDTTSFGFSAPIQDTNISAAMPHVATDIIVSQPISETNPRVLITDTTPPVITITGPSSITNLNTAIFIITSNEPATYTYTLDGVPAASPNILGLAPGSHIFTVRATDAVGNASTQTYTWTINSNIGSGGYTAYYICVCGTMTSSDGVFITDGGSWDSTGVLTGNYNWSSETTPLLTDINFSYSTSSIGMFPAGGSINGNYADGFKYSMLNQDWGIWQTLTAGTYLGNISDTWSFSLNPVDVTLGINPNIIVGTQTDGTQWSNGILAGHTYGYGADITNTPMTWISVGETIGTFDANALSWQAVQTGAWLDTNKFLAMTQTAQGQAALTALNIPFAEVGRANLIGSGNNMSVNMNDVVFFAYQTGAAPKIWATGNVNGTYTAPPVINTPVALTGNGLAADFTPKVWNTTSGNWMSTVNGGGTYAGTGTMNGSAVQMNGAAAGTNTGIGPGTFSGTAAGVAK